MTSPFLYYLKLKGIYYPQLLTFEPYRYCKLIIFTLDGHNKIIIFKGVIRLDQQQTIKTLNTLLQGSYMAINAYEHFIKKLQHSPLKDSFISIQKDFKNHAILLSERIQKLGGAPITSEGIIGKVEATIVNLMENYNSEEEIIKHAIKGENIYGIKMNEDLVRGKLDEESLSLVHKILDEDRKHVDYLKSLLHS